MKCSAKVGCLLAIAFAPAISAQDVALSSILGKWQLSPEIADKVPVSCQTMRYEITMTTITGYSGSSIVVAVYVPVRDSSGLLLRQTLKSHNGEPNCQGVPADFVTKHFQRDLEVDLVDGRLRMYFPTRASGNYIELVRP